MEEDALRVGAAATRQAGDLLQMGMNAEKRARVKSHQHDPVSIFDRPLIVIINR